jgi:nitrate/nitrite transporter NarK
MARNLVVAGVFRLIALFSMRYFYPIYFQAAFPDNYSEFSQYNALYITILGFIASLGAGLLSDKLSSTDPEENPYSKLIIGSCLASVPLQAVMLLN